MAKRKTFDVQNFKVWINERLASDYLCVDQKRGLVNALDHILHETGNYKGFGYAYKDDVRPCFPGKVGAEACNPAWDEDREYRRVYY